MTRVGIVTTSYPREPGDPAGGFVAGFARWLLAQGCIVEVVAAGPGRAIVDGVPVWRVPGHGLFYGGGAPDVLAARDLGPWLLASRFSLAMATELRRRGSGWEAAVSHWVAPSGLLVDLLLPRLAAATGHVAVAHSSDVTLLQRSIAGRLALSRLSRRADLVYSSAHLAVPGATGRVVPMGVDVASCASGDRARGRRRFMLQRTTALFLGRLVPVKGVDLLLEALPADLDLVIAGDGPLREVAEAQARRRRCRARFLGEVRGEAKADLLAAADLLVVPSRPLEDGRGEGTPVVIFEAQAAGLPVVATRCGGAVSAVRDGATGLLVDPTVGDLRRGLTLLSSSAELRERLGQAARERARERDWSVVGPELVRRVLPGLARR